MSVGTLSYEDRTEALSYDAHDIERRLQALGHSVTPHEVTLDVEEQLAADAEKLTPYFYSMEAAGWQPALVAVPQGLATRQWNDLLTGYELKTQRKSAGLHRSSVIETLLEVDAPVTPWRVAVVNATEQPALLFNTDKHTNFSLARLNARNTIADVLDDSALSSEIRSLAEYAPQIITYYALQWALLNIGREPVDNGASWTLLQERVTVQKKDYATFGFWNGSERTVMASYIDDTYHRNSYGVRPAATA